VRAAGCSPLPRMTKPRDMTMTVRGRPGQYKSTLHRQSYHTLTYELSETTGGTHISLSQDNNASEEEAEHSKGMWTSLLDGLKKTVERG